MQESLTLIHDSRAFVIRLSKSYVANNCLSNGGRSPLTSFTVALRLPNARLVRGIANEGQVKGNSARGILRGFAISIRTCSSGLVGSSISNGTGSGVLTGFVVSIGTCSSGLASIPSGVGGWTANGMISLLIKAGA